MTKRKRKIDCLLLHIPRFSRKEPTVLKLPHGFFSMASYLKKRQCRVEILNVGSEVRQDPAFSLKEYLNSLTDVSLIAVSLQWHYQTYHTIKVVEMIKRLKPNARVVMGGFSATFFYEQILTRFHFVDAVIRGDGERPLYELLLKSKRGSDDLASVPNLAWRNSSGKIIVNKLSYVVSKKDNDSFSFTDFDLIYKYDNYLDALALSPGGSLLDGHPVRSFVVPLGRGCSVDCAYCGGSRSSQKMLFGRKEVIFRDINSVVHDIQKYYRTYKIRIFHFCFDPCPGRPGYYIELFRRIRRAGLKIYADFESWGIPSKRLIDEFERTFLPGSDISLSPESGSESFRKKIKGHYYSNDQFYRALDYFEAKGIRSILYFIKEMPGQPESAKRMTRKMIRFIKGRYRHVDQIFHLDVLIEPAAPMHLDPEAYNIKDRPMDFMDYYKAHGSNTREFVRLLRE
ncbi:MAG: cobalamin-dependent protein [Candidatus Saganbacteria bacterium]|nr:cobalamin-dependent protein [Candidatus Saganbacteria bacterium]